MADLLWYEAAAHLKMSHEDRANGWPETLTVFEIAGLQYPPNSGPLEALKTKRSAFAGALEDALKSSETPLVPMYYKTLLINRKVTLVERMKSNLPEERLRQFDRFAWDVLPVPGTENLPQVGTEVVHCFATASRSQFRLWWEKQREKPSTLLSAWLKSGDEAPRLAHAFDIVEYLPSFPTRKDEWAMVVSEIVQAFQSKHGRCPNSVEAWGALWDNPPKSYGITKPEGEHEQCLDMGGQRLTVKEFKKRWRRWGKLPNKAPNKAI